MKRLACVFLFASVLLAPATAADDKPADDKVVDSNYFPLQDGTTWKYQFGENTVVYKVAKREKKGGVSCARVDMILDGKVQSYEHLGMTKEGLCRFTFEGKELNPPVCILKLPAKNGQTWKVSSKGGSDVLTGTFKEGEAEVKVPAGTYKAVSVTSQDLETGGVKPDITYYFAEKVGMVKQVIKLKDQKIVLELVTFEAGK